MPKLEDICHWYVVARSQRKIELWRGLGYEGTRSFEDYGCYKCNGKEESCDNYIGFSEVYNKGENQ